MKKKVLWERYSGEIVTFEYNSIIRDDELYFWLDVSCPRLLDIREELGLPRHPEYSFHLTIGNAR